MKKQYGFTVVEGLMIIAVVGIVGFAGYYAFNRNDDDAQLNINSSESARIIDQLPADLSAIKSISEIQAQSQQELPDKSIAGIELETDDGSTVYVVHFTDGSVVVYDAFTGLVLQSNDDDDDEIEDEESIPADFVASVSIQEAINIASQKRPSSILEKVELELEEGVVVYSVRFTDDSRVDVNALNGEIQRLKDENGTDIIKVDDDFDDDGVDNPEDDDDDDDGIDDSNDDDDDNDGIEDDDDDDDDNDGINDDDDDDDDENKESNSGSGSSNSGSDD